MPDIQQLPTSVINKIAAGEVIERPASVVKELVENSVDAGAKRIDVTIGKGGSELIQISDDGCGIAPEQLMLAVASHATSKLKDADDLFRVGTLGFRGEALASIAEVSQFCIRSRTSGETAGAELQINGGKASEVEPCGCPVGTSISVRNLFFNTPVRQKFMRTVQTEMGHITEALTRIALPHQDVHFTLTHNGRLVHDLPPVDDWRDRIAELYGRDLGGDLMKVSSSEGDIHMSGYVADPSQSRGNNRMQYIFLNGRHIKDRALTHALGEAYRGLLMTGRYAIAFLNIDLPADLVDVNVHPTKLEVRFQDSGKLYKQLLNMIRSRFLASDLTAKARLDDAASLGPGAPSFGGGGRSRGAAAAGPYSEPVSASSSAAGVSARDSINNWASSGATAPFQKFPDGNSFSTPSVPATGAVSSEQQSSLDLQFPNATSSPTEAMHQLRNAEMTTRQNETSYSAQGTPAMQVYNRYLITETEEGVVVIDQHALHERILYEEIREKVLSDSVEMQRLLVPEPVQLTAGEAAAVMENRETLAKLGVEVDEFGNDTILIAAYPAMLANLNPGEVLRTIAEKLMTPEKQLERRDLLDELLHMISCKAAIKAGDRLTSEEIGALIERRHLVQDAHHCPHGRPTTLVFSRDELDKRFKRI